MKEVHRSISGADNNFQRDRDCPRRNLRPMKWRLEPRRLDLGERLSSGIAVP